MDFDALLQRASAPAPITPRELWASLSRERGFGYLRDVQGQVLTAWDERRDAKDLVIKVNTGGGKTIDGLLILQCYLNAGEGPALYVAPDDYLVEQVTSQARQLSIATVKEPESPEYLAGDAIAVINIHKLVNGKSIFSRSQRRERMVPIGCVVIDDAHAAMATLRSTMAVTLPFSHALYSKLLHLFASDLEAADRPALLAVQTRAYGSMARVPFWAWRDKQGQVLDLLHEYSGDQKVMFSLPGISDVFGLCRAVFTDQDVSITPPLPNIGHIDALSEAPHRIYLTATLADDGVLVTHFGAEPESVRTPVTPDTAGDIGERMILAPEELTPGLIGDDVRNAIADLAQTYNTVVLVPSDRAAGEWVNRGATFARNHQLAPLVERLKAAEHVGLIVLANKYDGVDLPDDACRVLVIDGLPEYSLPEDRLEGLLTSHAGASDRQLQRIEQGMGRAVRSNEDHCVVFLLGARLATLVATPATRTRFGAATQAQLDLARTELRQGLAGKPLADIIAAARQALNRDPAWVKIAKARLVGLPAAQGSVTEIDIARRQAFEAAGRGDSAEAARLISAAAQDSSDPIARGWLLEQKAMYQDLLDPVEAQKTLAAARAINRFTLRPLSGVRYRRLSASADQARTAADYLGQQYTDPVALRTSMQAIADDLTFHPEDPSSSRADDAEEAVRQLAQHLGLPAERPEREWGAGPDDLLALGGMQYWVIEAKTGVQGNIISKRDVAQLSHSIDWFNERYDQTSHAIPVLIHPGRTLAPDAAARNGARVIDESKLATLRTNFLAYASALAAGREWSDPEAVNRLLIGHRLRAADLSEYLRPIRPSH